MGDSNTPERAVKGALEAYKTVDAESLKVYVDEDSLSGVGLNDGGVTRVVNERFDYKVIGVENISDSKSVVNTEITALNLEEIIKDFYAEIINISAKTDEEFMKIFQDIVENGNYKTVTNKVKIQVEKKEGAWKVIIDENLKKALIGKE